MKVLKCPLSILASTHPHLIFIQGEVCWSYLNFEEYVQQIQKKLSKISPGEVVAAKVICPYTTLGLFIACLRQKLIFFPLSPKLPQLDLTLRLKEVQAQAFIENKILFKPSSHFKPCGFYQYEKERPCSYLLTSGSSFKPKICVHSPGHFFLSAEDSNASVPYKHGDVWLLSLPLFHVGGLSLLFRTLLSKATLCISSLSINEALNLYSPTHLSLVPTQLIRLLKSPILLKKLKVILLGGAPIASSLLEEAALHQLPIYSTYGLTEMTSQVATGKNNNLELLRRVSLKVDSKNQILVKGPSLCLGYLENRQVKSCLNAEGWFETKDLGKLVKGRLQVLGRCDNQFISGGENILPEEIEGALLKHPKILEAVVVPKEDREFGHIPVAFIQSTHSLAAQDYISFLERFLPRFKIPKTYFPLSYEGLKPSRKKLKESLDQFLV